MEKSLYILKTRGTGKGPDQVQVRDEAMQLRVVFLINHPASALSRCHLQDYAEKIIKAAQHSTYGKISKLEL